jgi:hypothetical protein
MSEIDRVFARVRDEKSPAADRREFRSIPQRGTGGSRTVEVVHVRSGAAVRPTAQPRQSSFGVRAAAWGEGFAARQVVTAAALVEPVGTRTAKPIAHIMPARTSGTAKADVVPTPDAQEPSTTVRRARGRPRKQVVATPTRRVADPFDPSDDGANCIRCGYVVEPTRERRGVMTCAACG